MLAVLLFLGVVAWPGSSEWVETPTKGVFDFSGNPILRPPDKHEWLLGDPTIINIGNEIHMFANEVFHGIIHLVAPLDSPTEFTKVDGIVNLPGALRAYSFFDEAASLLYLFYEQYDFPLYKSSRILLRTALTSIDQAGHVTFTWNSVPPTTILQPELSWEQIGTSRVGNPFVFFNSAQNEFWLYYSASSVHLNDSNVDEPIYIGLAHSPSLTGPWTRLTDTPLQILGGDPDVVNIGIGSLKLIKGLPADKSSTSVMLGMTNRITQVTATNTTGSTISHVQSTDGGHSWQVVIADLIAPTLADPPTWNEAYCYGFDTIQDPSDSTYILTYYNGRNGWKHANETIGVSRIAGSLFQL